MTNKRISVCMATYNGEKYIRQQLESILPQLGADDEIVISDDKSSDSTTEIIKGFHDDRIKLYIHAKKESYTANFENSLFHATGDYIYLCDQDDIWLKDKIKIEKERMEIEEHNNSKKPIIIFSDLIVTDEKLNRLSDSFMSFEGIYPQFLTSFNEMGASNLTTGCTMLFNKIAKLSIQYPLTPATMHDSWITLCAARNNGILSYISEPLIYYRQHGHNTIGAVNINTLTISYRIKHLRRVISQNKRTYLMLKALGYGSWAKYMFYKAKYKYHIYKLNNKL